MKTTASSLALWFLAIVVGVAVARMPRLQSPGGAQSVVALLFGGARTVLSDDMFERADLYFHGGVEHHHEPGGERHGAETPVEAATGHHARFGSLPDASPRQPAPLEPTPDSPKSEHNQEKYTIIHEGPATGHDHDHAEDEDTIPRWDLWTRLNRRVHPVGHRHLRGTRYEKEILPWLWAAVRCNPRNVTAYDVAAYWVAERLHKPDDGMKILQEGIRKNPDAFRLEFTRGEILLRIYKDTAGAFDAFKKAMRKWQVENARAAPEHKPDFFQYGNILLYLATLSERKGALEEAKRYYEAALPTRAAESARRDIQKRLDTVVRKLAAAAGGGTSQKNNWTLPN